LKVLKTLGLYLRENVSEGRLVKIDDPRFFDSMWDACGSLGIPVAIHVSDPEAFFSATDRFNERFEELNNHPDWSFYGRDFPSNAEIMEARNRVFARHPKTQFIVLHVGNNAENLPYVSECMDRFPNMSVEWEPGWASWAGSRGCHASFSRNIRIESFSEPTRCRMGLIRRNRFSRISFMKFTIASSRRRMSISITPRPGSSPGPLADLWNRLARGNIKEGVLPERGASLEVADVKVRASTIQTKEMPSALGPQSARPSARLPAPLS